MDWKILEHLEWKSLHRVEIYEAAQQIRFSIYGFVLINLVILAFVCAIYSQIVGPKIDQLSRGNRNGDLERQLLNQETASSTGKKLFIAYCHQLWKRIALGVIFIILQTRLLYPLKFSSKFNCYLIDGTTQPRIHLEMPKTLLYTTDTINELKRKPSGCTLSFRWMEFLSLAFCLKPSTFFHGHALKEVSCKTQIF